MSIRRTELIAAGANSVLIEDINPIGEGGRLEVWASTPVAGGILTISWGSTTPFTGLVNVSVAATARVNLDQDGVCDIKIPRGVKNLVIAATVQAVRMHYRYTML